ncbi:hypothetical protein Tco_0905372, partial [Tanacetum coccineum]
MKKLRSARRPPRVGGIDAEGSSSGHGRDRLLPTMLLVNSVSAKLLLMLLLKLICSKLPLRHQIRLLQIILYQLNQFQTPTKISNAPQKNAFAFEVLGLMGTQPSAQSSVSSFTATTMTSPDPSTSPFNAAIISSINFSSP